MDTASEELARIKARISQEMTALAEEQGELDAILRFIDGMGQANLGQVSSSPSSARSRRRKAGSKSAEEESAGYEGKRAKKEENIGRLWEKIHDLQDKEKELEGRLGI